MTVVCTRCSASLTGAQLDRDGVTTCPSCGLRQAVRGPALLWLRALATRQPLLPLENL